MKQNWEFPTTEANAASFNTFQARLTETADYRAEHVRHNLVARTNALVTAMRESASLRSECFVIAHEAITSCADRIALGLNDMELAKISHDAQAGKYTVEELLDLGEGFFKLEVLNKIASAEITRQQHQGEPMDEVEIRLAYQVALRDRLNLPGVAQSMRYRRSAHVSAAAIDKAEQEVREKLEGSASVQFLAQWAPWCQAMERKYPESYAPLRLVHQQSREAISVKPVRMSEGEWMASFAAQTAEEAASIQRLNKQLTHQFLEEQMEVRENL